ncbi:MAG: hypothetical protein QME78_00520 [Thermodesulfobacteriota bacterium]|nr:hypothetical protein [Thermodesulfobacteriota bacterium]
MIKIITFQSAEGKGGKTRSGARRFEKRDVKKGGGMVESAVDLDEQGTE